MLPLSAYMHSGRQQQRDGAGGRHRESANLLLPLPLAAILCAAMHVRNTPCNYMKTRERVIAPRRERALGEVGGGRREMIKPGSSPARGWGSDERALPR